jgi:hypothetical protein
MPATRAIRSRSTLPLMPTRKGLHGVVEAKPVKIERVKYDGGDPLVYAKLNELIDAWNGGKA